MISFHFEYMSSYELKHASNNTFEDKGMTNSPEPTKSLTRRLPSVALHGIHSGSQ